MTSTLTHPHLTHPHTGEPIQAVGIVNGRPVWPIMGAAEGDGGGSDAGQDSGQSDGQNPSSNQSQGSDSGQSDSQSGGQNDGENSNTQQRVEDLPEWAQKLVNNARAEAGKSRTVAKQNAAEEARQQMAQEIGKALGLIKDDEQPDPEKLTQQLTAERATTRQSQIELAVYRTAGKHNGDPDALLDSRAFLSKVAELDPSATDFADKVGTAIKDAVAANSKLKTGQAPGASGADHSGQTGERRSNTPMSLADAVARSYGT